MTTVFVKIIIYMFDKKSVNTNFWFFILICMIREKVIFHLATERQFMAEKLPQMLNDDEPIP